MDPTVFLLVGKHCSVLLVVKLETSTYLFVHLRTFDERCPRTSIRTYHTHVQQQQCSVARLYNVSVLCSKYQVFMSWRCHDRACVRKLCAPVSRHGMPRISRIHSSRRFPIKKVKSGPAFYKAPGSSLVAVMVRARALLPFMRRVFLGTYLPYLVSGRLV